MTHSANALPGRPHADLPSWDELCRSMAGIFERQYYTETGPLLRELESRLQANIGFQEVICTINEFVAWLMVLDTLERGDVLVPFSTSPLILDCFGWVAHLKPVFWNLERGTTEFPQLITTSTRAVLLPATGPTVEATRAELPRPDIQVFCDMTALPLTGPSGADAHVCSMHGASPFAAAEGAYVATDSADLADRVRTMRSSSGVKGSWK